MKRLKWSKREDFAVTQLVMKTGECPDWNEMSINLKELGYDRHPKQIKSRWHNSLVPHINKEKWDFESIEKLFDVYIRRGNKWRDIAKEFEGRTDNSIKNQFFSLIRKALRCIAKVIGVDSIVSSTNIVNQIKPKILTNFLKKKIVLKVGLDIDEPKAEIWMMDIIKEFALNKTTLLNHFAPGVKRAVLELLLKILFDTNLDYKSSQLIAKLKSNSVPFSKEDDIYIIDIKDILPEYEQNRVLVFSHVKEINQLIREIRVDKEEVIDKPSKSVLSLINNLKETIENFKLKSNDASTDASMTKERLVDVFQAFQKIGEFTEIELVNHKYGNASINQICDFLSKMRSSMVQKSKDTDFNRESFSQDLSPLPFTKNMCIKDIYDVPRTTNRSNSVMLTLKPDLKVTVLDSLQSFYSKAPREITLDAFQKYEIKPSHSYTWPQTPLQGQCDNRGRLITRMPLVIQPTLGLTFYLSKRIE